MAWSRARKTAASESEPCISNHVASKCKQMFSNPWFYSSHSVIGAPFPPVPDSCWLSCLDTVKVCAGLAGDRWWAGVATPNPLRIYSPPQMYCSILFDPFQEI